MVYVVQRHVIAGPDEASEAEEFFERTRRAYDKTGYRQGIVLAYDPRLVDTHYITRKESELSRHGIEILVREWDGFRAGSDFYRALEIGGDDTKFIISSDDFHPDNDGVIDAISYMNGLLEHQSVVVGQRRRITLSRDKKLNERRHIHEIFLASIYPDMCLHNPFESDMSEVPPVYLRFGDRFSAFYGINSSLPEAQDMLKRLNEARHVADMDHSFGPEYYLVLCASAAEPLQLVCIPTSEDNEGSVRSEEEVDHLISYSTKQLLRTDLDGKIMPHTADPKTVELLEEFYPADEVRYVQSLMLD